MPDYRNYHHRKIEKTLKTVPPRAEPYQTPPGPEPSHIPDYFIVVGIIGGILILFTWQKYK